MSSDTTRTSVAPGAQARYAPPLAIPEADIKRAAARAHCVKDGFGVVSTGIAGGGSMTATHTRIAPKVAVVNCVSGPRELSSWIRESFVDALGTLDQECRVREFHLRQLVAARMQHCLFLSITVWDSLEDFDRWRTGPKFVAAHPDRTQFRDEFAQLHSIRLTLPVEAAATIADLDAAVFAQLRAKYPETAPTRGWVGFVSQLHWHTVGSALLGHRLPGGGAPVGLGLRASGAGQAQTRVSVTGVGGESR